MPRIAALLLAAGRSERMGRCKQLLPLAGKPLVRHCLETLIAAGLQEIIVVLGPTGREIAQVIQDLPVAMVENKTPASDMAESVRVGLTAVADDTQAVLVCLGDHPLVKAATVQASPPAMPHIRTRSSSRSATAERAIRPCFPVPSSRKSTPCRPCATSSTGTGNGSCCCRLLTPA